MAVVAALLTIASSSIWAEDAASREQPVCATNDYAMCSHAQCACIDPSDTPGACDRNNCDLGNDRICSPAYIDDTQARISAISDVLADDGEMQPSYCVTD